MMNGPERPGILRANAGFLLAGAGLIILSIVSPLVAKVLGRLGIDGGAALLCVLDALYYLPCILVPTVLYIRKHGTEGLRFMPVGVGHTFMCVLAAFLCVLFANCITGLWSMALEAAGFKLYSVNIPMENTTDLMIAIIAVAVLPGVCEELLFRGFVLSAYEKGGTKRAIIIAAILFATLHGSLQGLPVQFVMGMLLGCAVCFSGSLHTGIMIHMMYNALVLLISYAGRSMEVPEYTNMYEYLGGIMGVVSLLINGAGSGVLLWLVLRFFAKKGRGVSAGPLPKAPLKLDGTQIVVLISGIVTVLYLYGQDILMLTGYLQ